jgi:cell wall assembly regulator SMI1
MIKELITQLKLFSPEIIELNNPVSNEQIFEAEQKLGISLPEDYKTFIKHHNGLSLMGSVIYGISYGSGIYDLEKCYNFEHFEVDNPMPVFLVPFSPDGFGNHYCFDTKHFSKDSCNIVFWQHDLEYDDENEPEIVNLSFSEWVKEVIIDWTLRDYDYEGNSR